MQACHGHWVLACQGRACLLQMRPWESSRESSSLFRQHCHAWMQRLTSARHYPPPKLAIFSSPSFTLDCPARQVKTCLCPIALSDDTMVTASSQPWQEESRRLCKTWEARPAEVVLWWAGRMRWRVERLSIWCSPSWTGGRCGRRSQAPMPQLSGSCNR